MMRVPVRRTTLLRLLACLGLLGGLLAMDGGVLPASAQPIKFALQSGEGPASVRETEAQQSPGPSPSPSRRYGQVALASGVVAVGGQRQDEQKSGASEPGCTFFCSIEYQMRPVRTIGMPVDVQAFFTPIRYLGVGVHGYATVSPDANLLGVSLQGQVRFPL